jgi:hypothetical protein
MEMPLFYDIRPAAAGFAICQYAFAKPRAEPADSSDAGFLGSPVQRERERERKREREREREGGGGGSSRFALHSLSDSPSARCPPDPPPPRCRGSHFWILRSVQNSADSARHERGLPRSGAAGEIKTIREGSRRWMIRRDIYNALITKLITFSQRNSITFRQANIIARGVRHCCRARCIQMAPLMSALSFIRFTRRARSFCHNKLCTEEEKKQGGPCRVDFPFLAAALAFPRAS